MENKKPLSYYGNLTKEPFFLTVNQSAILKHLVFWIKTSGNKNGIFECYQSVRDIEKRTGLTAKTIQNSVKKLCEMGLLYKEIKKRHWNKCTFYSLTQKGYLTVLTVEPVSIFYDKVKMSESFLLLEPYQVLRYDDFLNVIKENELFNGIYEKFREQTLQRNDKGNGFDILPFRGNIEKKLPKKDSSEPQSLPQSEPISPPKSEPQSVVTTPKSEPHFREEKEIIINAHFSGVEKAYEPIIKQIKARLYDGDFDNKTIGAFREYLKERWPQYQRSEPQSVVTTPKSEPLKVVKPYEPQSVVTTPQSKKQARTTF